MRSLVLIPLVSLLTGAGTSAANLDELTFPKLKGRNLERRDIQLPRELSGRANLIIFGFVQDHQNDINTWIPKCEDLEREIEGFRFYEVPFLPGKYRLLRFWIDGGMRSGIPDQEARERTVTVYGGRREALQQLGVTDLDIIHLFLVTPSGQILWRSEGRWAPSKDNNLRELLKQISQGKKTLYQ